MWKRRIQLARIYQNKFRFYGIVKFGSCRPFIDRRSIDVQDKLEIGPNDPRLQEACKKAWDELKEQQLKLITANPNIYSVVIRDTCLHVNQEWVSAINSKGVCTVCGKTGFKPKRK